jgi:hypothetical protein
VSRTQPHRADPRNARVVRQLIDTWLPALIMAFLKFGPGGERFAGHIPR